MTTANRPARLNRGVLGLLGLVLVAGGAAVLAVHFGAVSRISPGSPLVPGTEEPPRLVFYAVIAGAVIVTLLALRWLAAQFTRLPRRETWQLGAADAQGRTLLGSDAAAAAVAADVETYPGVRSATARLSDGPAAPNLHLVIDTDPDADLPAIRRQILGHAVGRLCTALDLVTVPVSAEFRIADRARTARAL
ncbi:hypothetical protein [Nocardia thailandica]|uniref:hypothetical protein n=1 Tax=Nocardia thailandica TaxID=257275 RepID=UPI000314F620|nr:hypothetical protein [Nocardia thailandica]